MNKYSTNSIYQSEYAVAFSWVKHGDESKRMILKRGPLHDRGDHGVQKNHVNHYRHKLKQMLLEKLENMEATYRANCKAAIEKDHGNTNGHFMRHVVSPQKLKHAYVNRNHSATKKEDWQTELRRSRSLAKEFKEKNESTQIWWWNEDVILSSSESDRSPHTRSFSSLTRRPVLEPDATGSNRRKSFQSTKLSNADPSQSTHTRSSISAQLAQATGYQSTTEDFSSFNHDNDPRSSDEIEANINCSPPQSNSRTKLLEVPSLKLTIDTSGNSQALNCDHLIFHEPYQKEDFIKDSTSSESNFAIVSTCDTYRLS